MKCEIPLTPEQKIFAAENHDLIYKFLNENHLLEDEYYDVVAIGYLRAIRRYFSDSQLQEYSFGTVAWKGMLGALRNYNRVRCGQKHTAKILSLYTESGEDNLTLRENSARYKDLMTQLEAELLLHDLAKRVSQQQMEIVQMRSHGYNLQDIATHQNTSTKRIRMLLEEVRCILTELCRE